VPAKRPAAPKPPSKQAILRLVRVWRTRLHLHEWKLGVTVAPIPPEDDASAWCAAQPQYRSADLAFDPAIIKPDELEATVVHELLHCHVESLAALALDMAGDDPVKKAQVSRAEEELVTRLERAFMAAYSG